MGILHITMELVNTPTEHSQLSLFDHHWIHKIHTEYQAAQIAVWASLPGYVQKASFFFYAV